MDPSQTKPASRTWDRIEELRRRGHAAEALRALEAEFPREHETERPRKLRAALLGDLALEREAKEDFEGAAQLLTQAVASAPEFPDLHQRLGLMRLRLGDPSAARSEFETAARLAPRYVAPRLEIALLAAREGELGESLALLRRLGEEERHTVRAEFDEGLERIAEADWDRGEASLRRAFSTERGSVDRELRRIAKLLSTDRSGEALVVARHLVGTHPRYPDVHLALALVHRARGAWDDCAESCGRALEIHPDFHDARVYLAEALARRGEWSEADAQLESILAIDPQHPLARSFSLAAPRGLPRAMERLQNSDVA